MENVEILRRFDEISLGVPAELGRYRELLDVRSLDDMARKPELRDTWLVGLESDAVAAWQRTLKNKNVASENNRAVPAIQRELDRWEERWLGKQASPSLADLLRDEYRVSAAASWAVWSEDGRGGTPGNLIRSDLQLQPEIMLVGMNWGGGLGILPDLLDLAKFPWSTFHTDPRPWLANTGPHTKLRTLVTEVPEVTGAYMTDAFKLLPTPYADSLLEAVKDPRNVDAVEASKRTFQRELDVCAAAAVELKRKLRVIAFGDQTYNLLTEPTNGWPTSFAEQLAKAGADVRKVMHYAGTSMTAEKWQQQVREALH